MLDPPWSKVRRLEVTRQPGVMSMGGVGSFKVGVKAPAGTTPLEIATAGEAGAAASPIPHPQPAGAAPTAVAESTVSGAPVRLVDGMKTKINNALDMAKDFLGEGYIDKGNGRYVSRDGMRQVRMGDSDILGHHAGGRHMNFEHLGLDFKTQRVRVEENYHIFIEE